MSGRPDRLVALLEQRSLDALVVTNLVNVRYLSGFTGSNAALVIAPEQRVFFTDFRYVTQSADQVPDFVRVKGERDLLGDVAERVSGRVGFEDATMTVRAYERLRGLVDDGVELVAAGNLVEELRAVKEAGEVEAIRAAASLADEALRQVLETGLAGRTEREVALQLEAAMRSLGASEPSFESIVASGAHGALPHAEPRDVEIPEGVLVTIDWGARLDGYCSDCTRTYATGPLSDDAASVYQLVLDAQERSLDAVRAGAGGKEVDAVSRDIISAGGHGEHYGHGLGHGVGLDVHEAPRLAPTSEDTLAPANVVTVEPGVYVPDSLGVRIEDLVVVTDDGRDVLSGLSKELTTVD
ncbi:MAG: Xaa-Pro aminopeptidase [Thermoleophilaceae bacterium]|nr:Xaa-Pro aminopeptidase [Thermoleophilaceae bacterium]